MDFNSDENGKTHILNMLDNPFSNEVPELLKHHFDMLSRDSGISTDIIKQRGYRSILGKQHLKEFGFSKYQLQIPTLLIPIHTVDGIIGLHIHRPDNPRMNIKGKATKYEIPSGAGLRIDVPPICTDQLMNPKVRLFVTEGVKKADSLASRGECVIDLLGVNGFKHKNEYGATTITADFDYIAWKGREVFIVFDNDVMTKKQVRRALDILTEHLKRKGAVVKHIFLPSNNGIKLGVDDFLTENSADDLLSYTEKPEKSVGIYNISISKYSFDCQGYLCRNKSLQDGSIKVPIANFDATIAKELILDNGLETTNTYLIEAGILDKHLGTVEVPASSFATMNWVHKLGVNAIIEPGQSAKDFVRHYIQTRSNPDRIILYTHTGWREIDGEWVYLTSRGAIAKANVSVKLPQELNRYAIPIHPEDELSAIKATLEFLDIGDRSITIPLFSFLYLSPLTSLLSPMPNFSTYLYGETGVFKSTLAILLLSHFGPFESIEGLSNFEDTPNALGRRAFTLKDTLMVLDDYHPSTQRYSAQQKEMTAQRLIREFSNRTERGRLNPDSTEKPRYSPRGLLIITGEELISLQSSLARIALIEIKTGDIETPKLNTFQKNLRLAPHAMSSYINWIRNEGIEETQKKFKENFLKFRDKAGDNLKVHPKLAEQVAYLQFSISNVLDWLLDKQTISEDFAKNLKDESWQIFNHLTSEQSRRLQSEDPIAKFEEILNALLFQKKIRLQNKLNPNDIIGGNLFENRAELVGYFDDSYYYFLPAPLWKAIQQYISASGEFFPTSRTTLFRNLVKRGLAKERHSVRIGDCVHKLTRLVRSGIHTSQSTLSTDDEF